MSVNTASNGPGRLLLLPGEKVVTRCKSVEYSLEGNNLPPKLAKKAHGELYLTSRRLIFLCTDSKDLLSFSADFQSTSNVEIEQPLFGANYVRCLVRAESGGGWEGTAKLKFTFSAGGAIQFGKNLKHLQQGGQPPVEMPPDYHAFGYDPYNGAGGPGYYPPPPGPPPGGYPPPPGGYPGYPPPAPGGYYPAPPPPSYGGVAPPPNYTAPPSYVYDNHNAGPSTAAPPYNPAYNAGASQVMYNDNSNTGYVNNVNAQPGSSMGSAPPEEDKKTK